MTLDGHIKSGLAATLLLTALAPEYFSSVKGITLNIALLMFFLGNLAPDLLEVRISKERTLIPHRTITHYPWLYIAIAGGVLAYNGVAEISSESWFYPVMAFCAGAIMHLICDIPYGKLPYLLPTRKAGFQLISFESWLNRFVEHTVVIAFLSAFVLTQAGDTWWNDILQYNQAGYEEVSGEIEEWKNSTSTIKSDDVPQE